MTSSTSSVSPLRQRMLDVMRMRKLSPKTQMGYIRSVRQFAAYLKRSPDTATAEELRSYQLYMVDHGTSAVSINNALSGLKFLFEHTLDRPELMRKMQSVAISNSRLIRMDEHGVTFKWKDYRAKGSTKHKTMTLGTGEFMRRFLLHVLPSGFHRIRHYGLIANGGRRENLARARELLHVVPVEPKVIDAPSEAELPIFVCPHCGAAMRVIETLARIQPIRVPPHLRGPP